MKNLILISLFFLTSINFYTDWFEMFQADYFVNSATGDDNNTGTWLHPWETVAKVNSTTFAAGDRIGFKGTFSGTLTIFQNGEVGNPIIYKKYGQGAAYIDELVWNSITYPNIVVKDIDFGTQIEYYPENYTGTIYYVSSDGDLGNDGLSKEAPKPLSAINTLNPGGDGAVLINSIDTIRTTFTAAYSGTAGNVITYAPYGTTASKPVFSGFTTITGWTNEGGGLYSKTISIGTNPEIVTINGVQYAMGRTPNSDRYNPLVTDYFHIDDNIAGTVTSVANYNATVAGTILITTSSANKVRTGDNVTLNLTPTTYNGRYVATVVSSTTFYVTKAWASASATGTVRSYSIINDTEVPVATMDWTGATVVYKSSTYNVWAKRLIESHIGNTLSFDNSEAGDTEPYLGFGYFLQGDLRTLDQFGEWYYGGGKFYMFFGAETPTEYLVKVSTSNTLIDVNTKDFITINSIAFEGANQNAIETDNSAAAYNLTIDSCDFNHNHSGIYGHRAYELTITNCNFINSSHQAIYQHWYSDGCYVGYNTIDSTGLVIGVGSSNWYSGRAMTITYSKHAFSSKNSIIEYNTVLNSGFAGIHFSGDSLIVRNNFVDTYSLNKADNGGIQFGDGYEQGMGADTTFYSMKVLNNIILNGILNTEKMGLPVGTSGGGQFNLYFDYASSGGHTVDGNTIANNKPNTSGAAGLMIHGSPNMTVTNNTFFNTEQAIKFQELNGLGYPARNNTVTNNIVVSKSGQYAVWARSTTNDFDEFGTINNNYYAEPVDAEPLFGTMVFDWTQVNRTFTGWQTYASQDASSDVGTIQVENEDSIKFYYNNTKLNKNITLADTLYNAKDSMYLPGNHTLAPFRSIIAWKKYTPPAYELDTTELYAVYHLDESSGSVLDSHGAHPGTNSGAAPSVTGKYNTAYDFDNATDYVYMPIATDAPTSNSYSVSMWIKLDATASSAGRSFKIFGETVWTTFQSYKVDAYISTSNTLSVTTRNTTPTGFSSNSATGAIATTGVWYHIVLNIPAVGQAAEIYINGVKSGSAGGTVTGTNRGSNYRFYLGDYNLTSSLDGQIDEVMIFNRWLTPEEISYLSETDIYAFNYTGTDRVKNFLIRIQGSGIVAGDAAKVADFDNVIMQRFNYDDVSGTFFDDIKAINPSIKIFNYQYGPWTKTGDDALGAEYKSSIGRYNTEVGHSMGDLNNDNSGLFLLTGASARIALTGFPTHYLLDFGNSDFIDYWVEATKADILGQNWEADGLFLDVTVPSKSAINSALTGSPAAYTYDSQWRTDINNFISVITDSMNTQLIGINYGYTEQDSSIAGWNALDDAAITPNFCLEERAFTSWFGSSSDVNFFSRDLWKKQLDLLNSIENYNVYYQSLAAMVTTDIGTDNYSQSVTFWDALWFTMTSFKLGQRDNSYFGFQYNSTAGSYSNITYFDEFNIDTGNAIYDYTIATVGGVEIFMREFENAWVYVNPTTSNATNIVLPGLGKPLTHSNFTDIGSITAVNTINLSSHRGTIVMKTE